MGDDGFDHAGGELILPKSTVEAENELVQVLLDMRFGDAVEGADQESLEVADHQVHQGQPFVGFVWRGGARLVRVVPGQDRQALEGIAADRDVGAQAPTELADMLVADGGNRLGRQETSPPAVALHREQHRLLALGAAAALAGTLAAHQGVVRLHQPRQPVGPVPVTHGASQLAQHRLRRRQ